MLFSFFSPEIEMENIDDASEISDVSHINKVCQLLEVILYAVMLENLGPVVQSIVSLTSLLSGQLVKFFTTL